MKNNLSIDILLVDDSRDDAEFMQEVLDRGKLSIHLDWVRNGYEALAFLHGEEPYENAVKPKLILLDLNMPKMDGREFLEVIKKDEQLKIIPVIVLTTSDDEKDVLTTYNLQANCFITKPIDLQKFMEIIQLIGEFWLTTVTLPTGVDP